MHFGTGGGDLPQLAERQRIDGHLRGIGTRPDAGAETLEEVFPLRIAAVHGSAVRHRELQREEVRKGFAHGAAMQARQITDQSRADAVRVLMHDHFGVIGARPCTHGLPGHPDSWMSRDTY